MTTVTYSKYDPSGLFAGSSDIIARHVPFAVDASSVIRRGEPIGRVTSGGSVAISATTPSGTPLQGAGATVGNATIVLASPAIVVGSVPTAGDYKVLYTAATTFDVYDPKGDKVGSGTGGTLFADGISFTATAGNTAMVAGNYFLLTVTVVDLYIRSKATATDGSQVPVGVCAADVDATGGAVGGLIYDHGEFAGEVMQQVFDSSWTIVGLQNVLRQNNSKIYVRSLGALG